MEKSLIYNVIFVLEGSEEMALVKSLSVYRHDQLQYGIQKDEKWYSPKEFEAHISNIYFKKREVFLLQIANKATGKKTKFNQNISKYWPKDLWKKPPVAKKIKFDISKHLENIGL